MLLDRAHTAEPICPDSDPEPEPLASRPPLRHSGTSTSQTNTSDLTGSSHLPSLSPPSSSSSSRTPLDLSQILLNIKSCRWRHFRPRTLPRHSSAADLTRRGLRDFSRTASGLNGTSPGAAGSLGRAGSAAMTPVNGELTVASAAVSL